MQAVDLVELMGQMGLTKLLLAVPVEAETLLIVVIVIMANQAHLILVAGVVVEHITQIIRAMAQEVAVDLVL